MPSMWHQLRIVADATWIAFIVAYDHSFFVNFMSTVYLFTGPSRGHFLGKGVVLEDHISRRTRLYGCKSHGKENRRGRFHCSLKNDTPTLRLKDWLVENRRLELLQPVDVREGAHGRGFFAEENIRKGELLLRLAREMVVTPASMDKAILDLLPAGTSEWAILALFIILEKRRGVDTKWAPYIAVLPDPWVTNSTVFWSADEVEVLPVAVQAATAGRIEMIKGEYEALASTFFDHESLFCGHVGWDEFERHYILVCSRAWNFSESTEVLAMVPFCDFLNHSPTSRALLCHDEETNVVEVTSDRDYLPGEEVVISYGEHNNATLLLDFGFTIPNNPFDEVEVSLSLDHHDPLLVQKQALLTLHGVLLPSHRSATFKLRLVESPAGRGRGIPHPLRACARVMAASSAEELEGMEGVSRQEGRLARRPLAGEGGGREARAMALLQAVVERMVEEVTEAGAKAASSLLPPAKKDMVKRVFDGELRILTSVTAWLRPRSTGGGLVQLLATPYPTRR